MNSFVAVLFLAASAAAGGQFGYSTAQGTTHAVGVSAVHAAPVGLGYSGLGVAGIAAPAYGYQQGVYAAPAQVAYASPVVKTVSPVAQSTAFVNRAPAARLAVAAAPVAYAQPALVQSGVIASGPAYGYNQVAYGGLGGLGLAGKAYL